MPEPLKLGILGTSNSISKTGWVAALASSEEVSVVGNASLGSSHAALIPYRLSQLDNVQMDVLVLDVCVNEQRAVRRNLYNLDHSSEYFRFLLAWCFRRKVMPVVLILPVKEETVTGGSSLVRYHWIEQCKLHGIPYFDGYTFVDQSSFYTGKPKRIFFSDSHHLTGGASAVLATAFARRVKEFHIKATASRRLRLAHDYSYAPVEGDTLRKTSLLEERFSRLQEGETISVDCKDGAVTGVVLNMAQTNASIEFLGLGKKKRIDSKYYEPQRPLWLVAWSITDTPQVTGGALSVRAVASEESFEDNDHTDLRGLPNIDQGPVVEIAGFVIRHGRRLRLLYSTAGAPLALAGV